MSTESPLVPNPSEPNAAAALSRSNGSAGPGAGAPANSDRLAREAEGARRRRLGWRLIAPVLLVGALFVGWRAMNGHAKSPTVPLPAPTLLSVAVAPATRADLFNEVTIPAEFRPYLEVELHAKVSGYLEQISVDFGDRVKTGQ